MTWDERGGIVGIYSSGVKMTLKVRLTPMKTTNIGEPGLQCSHTIWGIPQQQICL